MGHPDRVMSSGRWRSRDGRRTGRTPVDPGPANPCPIRRPPAWAGAYANPRNLMGFLDAFKAVLHAIPGVVNRRGGQWGRDPHQLRLNPVFVMAGLVPAIHAFPVSSRPKTWMPGTSPGMTALAQSRVPPAAFCVSRTLRRRHWRIAKISP